MSIHGKNFIGFSLEGSGEKTSQLYALATNEALEGTFFHASEQEVARALEKAEQAFVSYSQCSGEEKAVFLDTIAAEIMGLGDVLVQRCMAESNLPQARIEGERARTVNQLKLFASLLREGSWVEATIDTAQPERKPLPKNDLRKMLVALGPVAVFEASNFPLAFAAAGGDTASALAAGCPVVVKAHSSHSGTSELVASAIIKAAKACKMPDGVFSLLHGSGRSVGQALVKHPAIKAVGFTGSYQGGMKLFEIAAQRQEPIPVFAEMGSINPVLLMPCAIKARAKTVAKDFAASITMGVGQFCTNPGLMLIQEGEGFDSFCETLSAQIQECLPATMLSQGIRDAFNEGLEEALKQKGVSLIANSKQEASSFEGMPTVAKVEAQTFIQNPSLHEEVFGPYSLLVVCKDSRQMQEVVEVLKGQLTTTVIAEDEAVSAYEALILSAQRRTGRMIYNFVPTGVEVCHSMQHGGPFPASTDARFTSVGTGAIRRFVRPVSFQDWPATLLPKELQDANPLKIFRTVDGNFTQH